MNESDIKFYMTCQACPEQYDAYLDGMRVGYLRLRHGNFTIDFPDVDGENIFYEKIPDDASVFTDEERVKYLALAQTLIFNRIKAGIP